MRLLKLMVYGTLGYVIYELVQGMRAPGGMARAGERGGEGQERMAGGPQNAGYGAEEEYALSQNMTGPGEGRREEAGDIYGGTRSYRVGRGAGL